MINGTFHIKVGKELLRVALSKNADEKVAADMDGLQKLLQDKNLRQLLQSVCYLPPLDAQKVLEKTFHGKVHELTVRLMVLLASQKALKYLGKIADVYRRHYHAAKGIKEMTIRTAREFSPQEQLKFVEKINTGKKNATVKFEIDAALIAGAQIYEGSSLTDYSVKNYLDTLRKHLIS